MIVIVDYGMGNIRSIEYKLQREGFEVILSSQSNDILSAEKLILPGVGNFKKAMNNLDKLNLKPVLNEAVINNAKPILGICLGMQLFSSFSEEGNVEGLDWIKGKVVKFKFSNDIDLAIPHVGWNHVKQTQKSKFGIDIDINKKYYFTHSYHFICDDKKAILGQTDYGLTFVSMVEKKNILGVQFHPEKSHITGFKIILDFINNANS